MKNIFAGVFLALICACTPSGQAADGEAPLTFIREFEGGKLYNAGPVNVVTLQGNYRQMGRQYGWLLKDDLNKLYGVSVNGFFLQNGFTYERLQTIARSVFDTYPQRFKELIYGMAETSGLGVDRQIVLNAIELYTKINNFVPNCSGIAAWGDYTSGGPLIFGRYNDDSGFYKDFAKYLVVTVFNPTDSSIPAAIINYAGVMYAPNGINREGLFLELNSGNWYGWYTNRLSTVLTLLTFLQDFPSVKDLDPALQSARPNISSIVNVADKHIAYSYECPPFDVKRRDPDRNGLLVATNHFVDPSWGIPPPVNDEQNGWTVKRRNNLLALGDKYKGKFDAEKMKEIMDILLDDGGATQPAYTIYQIIAVPGDLRLWLKAPGNFDWQKVDLNGLFAKADPERAEGVKNKQ